MSFSSLARAAADTALQSRTAACVQQEAREGSGVGTPFAAAVIDASADIFAAFSWPVALNTEAAYESAVIGGNPNPGGDPTVVTDAMILSAVQASWPTETAAA
jgi:hypothetical protein